LGYSIPGQKPIKPKQMKINGVNLNGYDYHLAFNAWKFYLSEKEILTVLDERELTVSERESVLKLVGMEDKVGKVDASTHSRLDTDVDVGRTYNNNKASTDASFAPREPGNPSTLPTDTTDGPIITPGMTYEEYQDKRMQLVS
jgi:hypothetical protein